MGQRTYKPAATLLTEQDEVEHHLPIDRPVAQYVRRSSMGQVKGKNKTVQSKYQQDEATEKRLRAKGFTDIRKIAVDDGKSGQRIDRQGQQDLYRMVKRREVGAIAFYDASRLWRDPSHTYFNDFIQMIQRFHVPIITHDQTFWPDNRNDMDKLREEFAHAAWQLRHFTDKVNPARLQAIELGQTYGGGCVPVGFLVVGVKGQKHFEIYEPHAAIVRWIFRRYRELSGNLSRLFREVRSVTFPPFEDWVDPPPPLALAKEKDGSGYRIRSRKGLISILTNAAYVGWYIFSKGEKIEEEIGTDENGEPLFKIKRVVARTLQNEEAHEAIVDRYDFLYAFNRLSDMTLDGERNEVKPEVNRRYGVAVDALLEGVLYHGKYPMYAMAKGGGLYIVSLPDDAEREKEMSIQVKRLDREFSIGIRILLAELEQRHEKGLEDELHQKLLDAQTEKAAQAVDYEEQLATIDKGIRGWEMDKQSARDQGYKPGLDEANRQLKRLHEDREALKGKQQQAEREQAALQKCMGLLDIALHQWDKLPFETQRQFVQLMIKRVNICEVAPHIIRMDIGLNEPFSYSLECHLFRPRGAKTPWSPEEIAALKRLYPTGDRLDILKAFPKRTWESVKEQATGMELMRLRKRTWNATGIHHELSWQDAQLMIHLGMNPAIAPWTVEEAREEPMLQIGEEFIPLNEVLVSEELKRKSGLDNLTREIVPAPEPDLSELPEQSPPPDYDCTPRDWPLGYVLVKRPMPTDIHSEEGTLCCHDHAKFSHIGEAVQYISQG
jgi:Resolvase, N terminal domain